MPGRVIDRVTGIPDRVCRHYRPDTLQAAIGDRGRRGVDGGRVPGASARPPGTRVRTGTGAVSAILTLDTGNPLTGTTSPTTRDTVWSPSTRRATPPGIPAIPSRTTRSRDTPSPAIRRLPLMVGTRSTRVGSTSSTSRSRRATTIPSNRTTNSTTRAVVAGPIPLSMRTPAMPSSLTPTGISMSASSPAVAVVAGPDRPSTSTTTGPTGSSPFPSRRITISTTPNPASSASTGVQPPTRGNPAVAEAPTRHAPISISRTTVISMTIAVSQAAAASAPIVTWMPIETAISTAAATAKAVPAKHPRESPPPSRPPRPPSLS